jgi:hypothetical protein
MDIPAALSMHELYGLEYYALSQAPPSSVNGSDHRAVIRPHEEWNTVCGSYAQHHRRVTGYYAVSLRKMVLGNVFRPHNPVRVYLCQAQDAAIRQKLFEPLLNTMWLPSEA